MQTQKSSRNFRSLVAPAVPVLAITLASTIFSAKAESAGVAAPEPTNKSVATQKSVAPATHAKASATKAIPPKERDDILKQVFALTEQPQSQENMDRLFSLEKEGQAALDKGDSSKALLKFQEMYGLCKELKYGDGEGRSLERMASIYLTRGDKSRAKGLVENAMEVLSESADKKSMGRTRVTASQVYLALDNPLWSLRQLDMAMKDFATASLVDNDEAARAMLLAANLALKIDKPKEAISFYRAAANYYGQSGDRIKEVNLRNIVAGMLQESKLSTAALEEAQKAVAAARQSKDPALLGAALIQLASAQYSLCEYMNTRKTMEEVFTLDLGKQPSDAWAVALEAHAHAMACTGDYASAKTLLNKCWEVWKGGGPPVHRAQVLNALAVLNCRTGKAQQSIEQFKQAIDASTVINPRQEKFTIRITQNLASAFASAGQSRVARQELENVLRSLSKAKKPDPQILGQVYSALGEICLQLKEISQADAYTRKSIEVSSKINDDAVLWRDYITLAKIQIGMQQPAVESLTSAASYFRSPQAGEFYSCESNVFPASRQDMACDLVSLLISNNMVDQALITAEQIKEEGFIAEWQRHGGEVKTTDIELYNDLVHERAHLHAAEASGSPDKLLKKWQDWMRRVQVLSSDNRELARLVSPLPLNFAELSKRAQDSHITVLDYLIGPRQSFVFTIDRQGKIYANKLAVNRDGLKAQVSALLSASAKIEPEARPGEKQLLKTLYSELIPEPVTHLLPRDPEQLVVFVPDSVLFNLPFAALVDASGRYMIESHTISSVSSMLGVMSGVQSPGTGQSIVLSIGNDSAESRDEQEADEISTVFQPEQVVKMSVNKTELSQLQDQARENKVLHFTSNLALQENSILKTALPIALVNDAKGEVAENLFKLSLPSDLAVWSATSVNYKDSQGNGVKVFSRGLSYAGIRSVLFSLWLEPEPERTAELVQFYKGCQQGLNQAQSLRKAQMLSLAKDPAPRSWAAFQLLGPGM